MSVRIVSGVERRREGCRGRSQRLEVLRSRTLNLVADPVNIVCVGGLSGKRDVGSADLIPVLETGENRRGLRGTEHVEISNRLALIPRRRRRLVPEGVDECHSVRRRQSRRHVEAHILRNVLRNLIGDRELAAITLHLPFDPLREDTSVVEQELACGNVVATNLVDDLDGASGIDRLERLQGAVLIDRGNGVRRRLIVHAHRPLDRGQLVPCIIGRSDPNDGHVLRQVRILKNGVCERTVFRVEGTDEGVFSSRIVNRAPGIAVPIASACVDGDVRVLQIVGARLHLELGRARNLLYSTDRFGLREADGSGRGRFVVEERNGIRAHRIAGSILEFGERVVRLLIRQAYGFRNINGLEASPREALQLHRT